MRNRVFAAALAVVLLASLAQARITGDYLETRSADVYTGACFANGEVGLTGDQAILAWHVREGAWLGTKLDGLNVVAAVKASATLGDPYGKPYPAKAVLIVDQRANAEQRQALIEFARHMGGKLFDRIVKVESAPIDMQVMQEHAKHGSASLRAGNFAAIETRAMNDGDHLCGNESTYYPPLTTTTHAMPAVAVTDKYDGPALGVQWTLHDKRSAFVGTFGVGD